MTYLIKIQMAEKTHISIIFENVFHQKLHSRHNFIIRLRNSETLAKFYKRSKSQLTAKPGSE